MGFEQNSSNVRVCLDEMYRHLYTAFGPQGWWPADTAFEVLLGAVLTQNTRWENVCMALDNLRGAGMLDVVRLAALDDMRIGEYIRPTGFYRQKSRTLRGLLDALVAEYSASVDLMLQGDLEAVRGRLLQFKGVGPETADSILLYAAGKPIFVIDAYTRRVCSRMGFSRDNAGYAELQQLFMRNLPADALLFNEYHALLVELAKRCCRKVNPLCTDCPLCDMCPSSKTHKA